jgi:hypothetical protein
MSLFLCMSASEKGNPRKEISLNTERVLYNPSSGEGFALRVKEKERSTQYL